MKLNVKEIELWPPMISYFRKMFSFFFEHNKIIPTYLAIFIVA